MGFSFWFAFILRHTNPPKHTHTHARIRCVCVCAWIFEMSGTAKVVRWTRNKFHSIFFLFESMQNVLPMQKWANVRMWMWNVRKKSAHTANEMISAPPETSECVPCALVACASVCETTFTPHQTETESIDVNCECDWLKRFGNGLADACALLLLLAEV